MAVVASCAGTRLKKFRPVSENRPLNGQRLRPHLVQYMHGDGSWCDMAYLEVVRQRTQRPPFLIGPAATRSLIEQLPRLRSTSDDRLARAPESVQNTTEARPVR